MNKKILIIDDDPAILEVTQIILSSYNYDVQTSLDGKILNKIKIVPDLIILDVLLSGEDGRQIVKKIRADSVIKNTPVVMFSADPSAADTVVNCGADDFISKPFEIDAFLKIVAKNMPS